MPKLKAEPAGRVRSIRELFALARAMEADAAARYSETATLLRQQQVPELAEVFDRLAAAERGHVAQVAAWAEHRHEPLSLDDQLPWPIPDTFDMPPQEVASSKLTTPYRALASAVRHEQRSFAFWTYVSAHADQLDVKEAAERMALEELEHVSLLRAERRKAFHAERPDVAPADRAVSLSSLAALERQLAELVKRDRRPGNESAASSIVASSLEAASSLDALAGQDKAPSRVALTLPSGREQDIDALAEYLAEAYLQLADVTQDARLLASLQELAKLAVYRLGVLTSGTANPDDI